MKTHQFGIILWAIIGFVLTVWDLKIGMAWVLSAYLIVNLDKKRIEENK